MISALVAAGISMATLAAILTSLQFSQRAGQGVQGKSEFGALVDSVRSIAASSDSCKAAFVDASGVVVKISAPSASADSSVEAEAIRVGGADFIRKGEKAGAITLQAIRLTRPKGTSDLLSVQLVGQKQGEVLGSRDLQNAKPLLLQASFGADSAISSCQLGGSGAENTPVVGSSCPAGMIEVSDGPSSKRFCIDAAPRANAKYPDAVRDCYRRGSELCSAAQWSIACEAHSATNSTFFAAPGKPSQPHEWIQAIFPGDSGNGYVALGGGGNCWNSNPDPFTNLHPYRCCWTPNVWADLSGSPGPTEVLSGTPCGADGKGVTFYHSHDRTSRWCCYVGGGADTYPIGGKAYTAFSRVPCLPY